MKDFSSFWTFLETSHPQWWDFTKMRFFSKDLKKCAMDCYAYLLSDPTAFNKMDDGGKRKYFIAWLLKAPDAPVKIDMSPPEPFKESENFLVGEERQKRLKEFKAAVLATPALKPTPRMTRKEFEENGGWKPKKEAPYPSTPEAEVREHDKRLRAFQEKSFRDRHPGATEEQVKQFLESI